MGADGPEAEEPYEVVLSSAARRAILERLPAGVAFAVMEFLDGPLAERPRRVGAPLNAPFRGYFRARRGEYRIRYRIDDETRRVYVVDVDHRRDAYRS